MVTIPDTARGEPCAPPGDGGDGHEPALNELLRHVQEVRREAERLLRSTVDLGRAKASRTLAGVIKGIVLGFVGLAVVLVAVVLLLVGAAAGIADLMDAPAWAGHLILGAVIVLPVVVAPFVWDKRSARKRLERLKQRYASLAAKEEPHGPVAAAQGKRAGVPAPPTG